MTKTKNFIARTVLALLAAASLPAFAQPFELSGKAYDISWQANAWNGEDAFPPVYCLTFPSPREAQGMTKAMFNRNTISLTRVVYQNNMALYVVTSTIPAGRTPEEDTAQIYEANRRSAEEVPQFIKVQNQTSPFGPTVGMIIRNSIQGGPQAPFPLARGVADSPDGLLRSLSVHKLFARGPDRFEIAALRYFKTPVTAAAEQQEIESLSVVVNSTLDTLYQCTSNMPIRSRG